MKILLILLMLVAMPASANEQLTCLAKNIYFEARGEPLEGQLAVAFVTLNRATSKAYEGNLCDVVYAPGQFSWTRSARKISDATAWRNSQLVARMAILKHLQGEDITNGALYFTTGHFDRRLVAKIGNHKFYQ